MGSFVVKAWVVEVVRSSVVDYPIWGVVGKVLGEQHPVRSIKFERHLTTVEVGVRSNEEEHAVRESVHAIVREVVRQSRDAVPASPLSEDDLEGMGG